MTVQRTSFGILEVYELSKPRPTILGEKKKTKIKHNKSNSKQNQITKIIFSQRAWLVLCAVRIFLSLPTGNDYAFVSRRVHPLPSLPFFITISRFSGWAVFLNKDISHHLKPINNLLILCFLSLKSLWLTEKYWLWNEFVYAKVSLNWLTSGLKPVCN